MKNSFQITLIYVDLDESNTDAKNFALAVRKNPTISVYEPKIFHFRLIEKAIEWIKVNPPPLSDGAYVVCWDITKRGLTSAEIESEIQNLYDLGIERDCVIVMASSQQTDLLWTVLREKLGADRVINRRDALETGIMQNSVGDSISASLFKRTSNPDKIVQLTLLNIEGQLNANKSDIEKLERRLRRQVDSNLPGKLEELAAAMNKRVESLETAIFPARNLTGAPSILTIVNSMRQMVASHAKEIEGLDRDIGKLADLTDVRRQKIEKSLEALAEAVENSLVSVRKEIEELGASIRKDVEKLQQSSEHKMQIQLARQNFFYTTAGKILTVSTAVLALIVMARYAPDAAALLESIIKVIL